MSLSFTVPPLPPDGPEIEGQPQAGNGPGPVGAPGPGSNPESPSGGSSLIQSSTDGQNAPDAGTEVTTADAHDTADSQVNTATPPSNGGSNVNESYITSLLNSLVPSELPPNVGTIDPIQVSADSPERDSSVTVIQQPDNQPDVNEQLEGVVIEGNKKSGDDKSQLSDSGQLLGGPQEATGLNSNSQAQSDSVSSSQLDMIDVNSQPQGEGKGAAQQGGGGGPGAGRGPGGGPGGMGQPRMSFQAGPRGPGGQYQRASFGFRQAITRALAEMLLEEKVPLGTQIDDFILDCEYNGYACNTR